MQTEQQPSRPADRAPIAGPDSGPESPFPLRLSGPVIRGFGRGSKELGIPTANIPIAGAEVGGRSDLETGIYFGWAGLDFVSETTSADSHNGSAPEGWEGRGKVHPMVMSIGWNPYYKNTVKSVEVHIMHDFGRDFYDAQLNLLILGFIRPEYDYVSKELLIEDIKTDIQVAERSLARPTYRKFMYDPFLLSPRPSSREKGEETSEAK